MIITVKYRSFSGTDYIYHNIIEIKDYPDLAIFILKSSTDEYYLPKYAGINLLIDTD